MNQIEIEVEQTNHVATGSIIARTRQRTRDLRTIDYRAKGRVVVAHLQYQVMKLGAPGKIGLVTLLATLIIFLTVNAAMEDEYQGLLQNAAVSTEQAGQVTFNGVETQVDLQPLPSVLDLPGILKQVFVLAQLNNVELLHGDYGLVPGDAAIQRYSMKLPTRGTYPDVRSFVKQVLALSPAIALTSLSLSREVIGKGEVEVNLEFTTFLQGSA